MADTPTIPGEGSKINTLSFVLAKWLSTYTDDAPQALTVLAEVVAEYMKLSDNVPSTREKWIGFLDRYLQQPNHLLAADDVAGSSAAGGGGQ